MLITLMIHPSHLAVASCRRAFLFGTLHIKPFSLVQFGGSHVARIAQKPRSTAIRFVTQKDVVEGRPRHSGAFYPPWVARQGFKGHQITERGWLAVKLSSD